jgi:hypothetical protein
MNTPSQSISKAWKIPNFILDWSEEDIERLDRGRPAEKTYQNAKIADES